LLTDFTQTLMTWAQEKCPPNRWLDAQMQAEALSALAFETQARAGFGTQIKTDLVKAVMPEKVQPDPAWPPVATPPDQILTLAASAHIIEMPVDRGSVRFYHQLLQEYFAARELLKRVGPPSIFPSVATGGKDHHPPPVGESRGGGDLSHLWRWPWLETDMPLWQRPADNYDPLPPPPPTGWEETTILAAGLAPENDAQLIRALIEINPVLAGRCLHEGQARVDRAVRQAVIDELLATIARPEVALRVRIAAGEVLGYLGDPRLGDPPLGELVTIPAGAFLMGEGEGQHKLYLPEYRIGKYPVTNAEFGRFVEAGGYQQKRWWTEAGWAEKEKPRWEYEPWTEPRSWRDGRFNQPNQPVVGISWYEAVAYCRWLSTDTGQPYRLPTEAEWEKAARGPDGRRYPWGHQFEAGCLNARQGTQWVHAATPVGIYPTGASPFGLFDCAGNVWEWCATEGGKPYPYDIGEDEWQLDYLNGINVRVLRGGSWYSNPHDVRCVGRSRDNPDNGDDSGGCRVAVFPI
jgi:formylglycine-generating enzyme required for sulfatase activity